MIVVPKTERADARRAAATAVRRIVIVYVLRLGVYVRRLVVYEPRLGAGGRSPERSTTNGTHALGYLYPQPVRDHTICRRAGAIGVNEKADRS